MSRIQRKFLAMKQRGETALIPFITAGDPDLPTTLKIMRALEAGGADAIEVGIPFSDPSADGPTIQRSSERALRKTISLPAIFRLVRHFRRNSELPIILFGYYNPFFRFGLDKFAAQAARAGADGVLCVDLPPEESGELKNCTDRRDLDVIFLLSPTSGLDRRRLVAHYGRGFIYYVAVTGVTGARQSFATDLRRQVAQVRKATSLPVGVGFGISTPKQAAAIAEFADAVVVGSALVQRIEQGKSKADKVQQAGVFVAQLKRAMNRACKKT